MYLPVAHPGWRPEQVRCWWRGHNSLRWSRCCITTQRELHLLLDGRLAPSFTSPFRTALPYISPSQISSCGDTSFILTHIYPNQSTDVPTLSLNLT